MKLYGAFIGINEYKDKRIHNLQLARHDALRFNQLVQDYVKKDECKAFILTDQQATRSEILHLIGVEIAGLATRDDIVLIHFACHGSPEIGIITNFI